ncbi:hypothetical protein K2Q02_00985 [Patescibacteria group bacterium]|nr:hypothetical protein [Patescibacteria group bacterium]
MNIIIGFIAGCVGFATALYIFYKKNKKAPLMCPRRSDCTTVVNGKYSTTLGIPNDILGIVYYAVFATIFGLLLLGVTMPLLLVKFISAIGMLFTIYLVAVQAFVIRLWCLWCLVSAVCAVVLFFAL